MSTSQSNQYAHSVVGKPPSEWEPLSDHLRNVSQLATEFAKPLNAEAWGRIAGLWHDLGKYSKGFQDYLYKENGYEAHLEGAGGRVDHSTAGAWHAVRSLPQVGKLLAYVLAGHHAGLADGGKLDERLDVDRNSRLRSSIDCFDVAPSSLLAVSDLELPTYQIGPNRRQASFQLAFFTRMVFSCLVDADFLATESFMSPDKAAGRSRSSPSLEKIAEQLELHMHTLTKSVIASEVNDCRQLVLEACRQAASKRPGLFSLTVPTGGGKTLSSLEFALKHALRNKLSRVIYAIPFTSIIEQTAATFRDALGDLGSDVVLEHHSNIDPNKETPLNRLMAENWDAPLVVTTNVQLFESLFANRTSRCRKLHNVANSVIVLDEVQTLPVELLRPCIEALRELTTNYNCTIVLCTATQPAIEKNQDFSIGLKDVREIIPQPAKLHERMRRVEVEQIGPVADDELLERLAGERSFLCIVNTRPHAAKLFGMLRDQSRESDPSMFHLSTLLCGANRGEILTDIKQRLEQNLPCQVISTQLIEAGVDIDFPAVYRAVTGLDSVAQAAGRCNREGRLSIGKVYLFDPVECQPEGYLGAVAATAREVLPDFVDPLDPAAIATYFDQHYWKQQGDHKWDDKLVMQCFPEERGKLAYDFKTAAERFRMIEENGKSICIPYSERGEQLCKQLRHAGPSRGLLRLLQRYTVSVYEQVYQALLTAGDIELTDQGYAMLTNDSLYDKQLGLMIDRPGFREPESLVV